MISTCILINDCILQDFKPPVDVSIEDVKRVREMLCEYILMETIDRKGNFYSSAPWVYCDQRLETHSVFFSRCCCLRNLPGLLGWGQILPGSGSFLMTPSKQALMRVTWNLMWSYDPSLSINVILLCLYLWCENVLVMSPCCGGCQILAGSRMQPLVAAKSWLVPGCCW
jgi:hypothetical protein